MTRSDFMLKWSIYALALVPVWVLELYVLSRYPLFGVKPMLMPLAAVAVAVLEGSSAGGGFGLFVGILCDAFYHDTSGSMTVMLCLIGVCAGAVSRYALRQNLLGCLLCSLGGLLALDGARVVVHLFRQTAPLDALLRVALPEVAWSLVFAFPVYALFSWVFQRVPKKTLL